MMQKKDKMKLNRFNLLVVISMLCLKYLFKKLIKFRFCGKKFNFILSMILLSLICISSLNIGYQKGPNLQTNRSQT